MNTFWLRKTKITYKIWSTLWSFTSNPKIIIKTKIHGFNVILPAGHWYLLVLKKYLKFNQPLVSLLKYSECIEKRPLKIIDIGSAVGDTILLLESKSSFEHAYICIDGDEEYNTIAKENLTFLKTRVTIHKTLVSEDSRLVGQIVKDNPTTGTSKSSVLEKSRRLDDLFKLDEKIDLAKIDIDGFDGQAIGGFKNTLKNQNASIIFEWNVPLFESTKNHIFKPFYDLKECGYTHFYWFDNTGNFLFYNKNFSEDELQILADYSKKMEETNGYHYDIIALKIDKGFINYIK